MSKINDNDKNIILQWLDNYIDKFIESKSIDVKLYTENLKSKNPGISDIDLAEKINSRKSLKNGIIGGLTSVGGLITLPVTVPTNLIATWRVQIMLAYSIAYVFGHTSETTNLKTDLYIILAGNAATKELKNIGIKVSQSITKKAIDKYITREVMKKIWKVIPQKILTKAGQKSLTSFTRMIPLFGIFVGFAFDYYSTKIVGNVAIKYYSGK